MDVVKCWAQENGIPGTFSVLCNNSEVKQLIMDDMIVWGKEAGLKSFEQVSSILGIALIRMNGIAFLTSYYYLEFYFS